MRKPGEAEIRERAYSIWEREGCPVGRELDHWVLAEVELAAEGTAGRRRRSIPRPGSERPREKSEGAPRKGRGAGPKRAPAS